MTPILLDDPRDDAQRAAADRAIFEAMKRPTRLAPRCTNSPACARGGCDDCQRSYGPQS